MRRLIGPAGPCRHVAPYWPSVAAAPALSARHGRVGFGQEERVGNFGIPRGCPIATDNVTRAETTDFRGVNPAQTDARHAAKALGMDPKDDPFGLCIHVAKHQIFFDGALGELTNGPRSSIHTTSACPRRRAFQTTSNRPWEMWFFPVPARFTCVGLEAIPEGSIRERRWALQDLDGIGHLEAVRAYLRFPTVTFSSDTLAALGAAKPGRPRRERTLDAWAANATPVNLRANYLALLRAVAAEPTPGHYAVATGWLDRLQLSVSTFHACAGSGFDDEVRDVAGALLPALGKTAHKHRSSEAFGGPTRDRLPEPPLESVVRSQFQY